MYEEQNAKKFAAAMPAPGFYNGPMEQAGIERDRPPLERAMDELLWSVSSLQERINALESRLRPVMQVVPEGAGGPPCPPSPSCGVPLVDAIASQVACIRAADDRLSTIHARLGV